MLHQKFREIMASKEIVFRSGSVKKIHWELFSNIRDGEKEQKKFVNLRVFRTYEWNSEIKRSYSFGIWESAELIDAISAARQAFDQMKAEEERSNETVEDIF